MQSKIERQVMASVGTIYAARALVSATALKLYVCALALFALGRLVWVERVFSNFSQVGLSHAAEFIYAAILNTDLMVQLILLALVVVGVSLVRDLMHLVQPRAAY